ncbi:MAG: protein phosphatase 2C domain-containing protein [Acidimicrobiales bacterium]|nr:protein phosphatase 2C domain-containing protein [Acidimicrobiales bacterium]
MSGSGTDIIDTGIATDVGGRSDNQDRGVIAPGWGAVSDGMGGYEGGARAAELSIAAVQRALDESAGMPDREALERAFQRANGAVLETQQSDPDLANMGATLTVAVAQSVEPAESVWLLAHVGDSPAYLVTGSGTRQVTTDHTVPGQLLREGAITEDEAEVHPYRNMLLQGIGVGPDISPDFEEVRLEPGESLVLASDGLSGVLSAADVGRVVAAASSAGEAAQWLVKEAIARETTDNVTVVVLTHRPKSDPAD